RWAVTAKADLRGADLRDADLSDAYHRGADLREADLCGAPVIEDIHAKVYAAASQPGALDMCMWHCGTSHCRAGWVVTLAGKEGADLEAKIGTPAAAMAIYMVSDPERWKAERLPNFYCGNTEALADMARMAGVATYDPPTH
ncbi:MAG: pentapeptide repeat-containing protein, partial [bacterium]